METWGYPYKHIPRRRSDQSAPVLFDKDPQPDETLVSGMGSSPGTETKQPSDGPGDSVGVNEQGWVMVDSRPSSRASSLEVFKLIQL